MTVLLHFQSFHCKRKSPLLFVSYRITCPGKISFALPSIKNFNPNDKMRFSTSPGLLYSCHSVGPLLCATQTASPAAAVKRSKKIFDVVSHLRTYSGAFLYSLKWINWTTPSVGGWEKERERARPGSCKRIMHSVNSHFSLLLSSSGSTFYYANNDDLSLLHSPLQSASQFPLLDSWLLPLEFLPGLAICLNNNSTIRLHLHLVLRTNAQLCRPDHKLSQQ